ncbi:MAG: hypothetical protein ACI9SC_001169, partial [Gammaproteobacteria bacterium]
FGTGTDLVEYPLLRELVDPDTSYRCLGK